MSLLIHNPSEEFLDYISEKNFVSDKSNVVSYSSLISVEDVKKMLGRLDPDMSYLDWVKVGMALHADGFGVEIWEEWSEWGFKHKEGECRAKWQTFSTGDGITIATLIKMAKEKGYSPNENRQKPASFMINQHSDINMYSYEELIGMPRKKYLIKNVIDQGALSVVYGPSNSGKTFLAIDIALHVATGRSWCERNTKQGNVVYIASEGGLSIVDRLNAFIRQHNLDQLSNIFVIPKTVFLNKDQSECEKLLAKLNEVNDLKLLVIDTLARSMGGGDENSSIDMGAFISQCDQIRLNTNAHVMIVHHSGKVSSSGARGHSSLKAAVDTEIKISQKNGLVEAKVEKQRDGQTGHEFCFELNVHNLDFDEDGDPITSCALQETFEKPKISKLRGQAAASYSVLKELIDEKGEYQFPKHKSEKHLCVSLSDFKECFEKANISDADKSDSVQKAFTRAKANLIQLGFIEVWKNFVWLKDK